MPLHVFVAMPFGRQQDIDFDAVYGDCIRPALESAGFEVFRADQAQRAGDIREDMFQELLLVDLVLADLSIDNPNVWYELGVRHALRARGVLLVQSGDRPYQPFDTYTDRKLRYHLKDGVPDPAYLDADRRALAEMARATVASWHGRRVSPVFNLLAGLREPDWRDLLLSGGNGFRAACETWRRRVEAARNANRPGDILVLAEEAPTLALRLEARCQAAKALTKLGQLGLALEQYEAVLAMDPDNLAARQARGTLLGRLGRRDEAREWIGALIRDQPADPECWSRMGRLEQEAWVERWRQPDRTPAQMRETAAREMGLLLAALAPYMNAFVQDPAHSRSGINACTLRHLQLHLGGCLKIPASESSPTTGRPRLDLAPTGGGSEPRSEAAAQLSNLEGGVLWACLAALEKQPRDYRTRASLAELELLLNSPEQVQQAWREAVAVADRDWFALDSSRQQLRILRDLEFRPEAVAAALAVLEAELARLEPPWRPRRIFLFSGHMIDAPGRTDPRFPADKATLAGQAIDAKLSELGMGTEDLAICGGACGGDTLFAEAALKRGCRLHLHLQFPEPDFLQASVAFAGDAWVDRYYAVRDNPLTTILVQPEELGPLPRGVDPYERNNQWQLYTALAQGPGRVHFIALWNGGGGSGPGGTQHMVETVRHHAGRVSILDTRQLFTV